MASVNVTNIEVLDNPSTFLSPFQFQITFETVRQIQDDIEWRLIYVGSANSEEYDQLLDSVLVGPVPMGINRFVFQAPAPDPSKIPSEDLLGVTVCLLIALYKGNEFLRVGYYVSNELPEDMYIENGRILQQRPDNSQNINLKSNPTTLKTQSTNPNHHFSNTKENYGNHQNDDDDGMDIEHSEGEDDDDDDDDDDGDEDEEVGEDIDNEMNEEKNESESSTSDRNNGNDNSFSKPGIQANIAEGQQQSISLSEIDISKIKRVILADKPRVTRFFIDWDSA